MKKSTKKVIIAIVIILTFGLSTIAFVATGLLGKPSTEQDIKPLANYVIDGDVDYVTESTYIQNGYTWVKYYYTNSNPNLMLVVNSLPDTFTTPSGQMQIIVQKFNQNYSNETSYMIITSISGQETISNPDENKIFDALCRLLTITPVECSIAQINITA